MAVLKDGLDSVNATVNDSTIFVATKGQLILYWNVPHTAWIADGRFGYIPPEQLFRVDTLCFKFNFSKYEFRYARNDELFEAASWKGEDLNALVKRIKKKDKDAMLKFFDLRDTVDGAAAEILPYEFWRLINLWTDKELSAFISTLDKTKKKEFCELLIESSFTEPYEYYKSYYPLTLKYINQNK
jgi:hypothetical protein